MKTIEFWLVRHGQTEENVKRILCGQQGGTLTQLGIKQAESLGKRLSNEKFDQIYVSDLSRTRHTFDCIQKFQSHKAPVQYTNLLMEKNAGSLDGQSLDVPKQLAANQNIPIRNFRPENGEAWVDVMERSKQFIFLMVINHLLSDQKISKQLNNEDFSQLQQQEKKQQPPLKLIQKNSTKIIDKQIDPMQIQIQGITVKEKEQASSKTHKKPPQIIKILGVSHGGFIMEILNFIKLVMDKKQPVYQNDSVNCSVTIFQINLKQLPVDSDNIQECLDIKVILKNDNKHCSHIK